MKHEYYINHALLEAKKAYDEQEVPVGAIIVMGDKIIARGYNQVEKLNDSTAHAEIIALTSAFHYLGSKYLPDATLYVTVEPCVMCAGAIYWSKISTIVYGTGDQKNGYSRIISKEPLFPAKTTIISGICNVECASLMKSFFKARR